MTAGSKATAPRRFASGIPVLTLAYGVTAAATFLLSVVVGRGLGAAALGAFSLAVSIARIFYASTELGLAAHLTRVVARDRDSAQATGSLFLGFRAALIPAGMMVTACIGFLMGHTQPIVFAFVAAALGLVTVQSLYEALLLSHARPGAVAVLNVLGSLYLGAGCMLWFAAHAGLRAFGTTYLATSLLAVLSWALLVARKLGLSSRPLYNVNQLRSHLRQSWPIGMSNLLGIAALKSPIVVLGAFSSDTDVGAFSAVDVFVTASAILQTAVSGATFPRLAESYRRDPRQFRRLFWATNALLGATGLVTGTFLVLWGADVAHAIFPSKDFHAVYKLMPIAGWSTPALMLAHHNILVFAAGDRERTNFMLMASWFLFIVAAQLILVPLYGVTGAVWAVLTGRILGLTVIGIVLFGTGLHQGARR